MSTRAPDPSLQRVGAGIALKLAAVLVMGVMTALVKLASERGAHTFEIVFFRNFFAFAPITAYILATRGMGVLRTSRPVGHVIRSTVGISGMICGFAAVGLMPLTEYTAVQFAAPLFITALSAPVLGEHVGPHRWAAVIIGFAGVIFMLRPDPAQLIGLGGALALGQSLGTAGAMLTIRQLGATEPGATIVFYFTLAATLVGAVALPFVWTQPSLGLLLILVGCGLCGGVGQLLMTEAFRIAPAAAVAPFDYAALPWAGVIGYLVWRETPALTTVVGGTVVTAAGLYIVAREAQLRRRARG